MTDETTVFGSLDDLPESTDVAERRPRAALSIAALLLGAVLAVIVVVFAVGTVAHVIEVGGNPPVAPLTTVEQNTGIDLPEGTEVLDSAEADGSFSAELLLPPDTLPDFPLAGYGEVDAASEQLASRLDGENVVEYLGAANETVVASAALVERDGDVVLFVDVRPAG